MSTHVVIEARTQQSKPTMPLRCVLNGRTPRPELLVPAYDDPDTVGIIEGLSNEQKGIVSKVRQKVPHHVNDGTSQRARLRDCLWRPTNPCGIIWSGRV